MSREDKQITEWVDSIKDIQFAIDQKEKYGDPFFISECSRYTKKNKIRKQYAMFGGV